MNIKTINNYYTGRVRHAPFNIKSNSQLEIPDGALTDLSLHPSLTKLDFPCTNHYNNYYINSFNIY